VSRATSGPLEEWEPEQRKRPSHAAGLGSKAKVFSPGFQAHTWECSFQPGGSPQTVAKPAVGLSSGEKLRPCHLQLGEAVSVPSLFLTSLHRLVPSFTLLCALLFSCLPLIRSLSLNCSPE
jgi:hypothetical protein